MDNLSPDPFAIVDFFTARPELVAELLRVHVDDGTGHCRGCAWWQSATPVWPCSITGYARQAAAQLRR